MAQTVEFGELVDYVKAYAKQETIEPLRGLGRWIGMGLAGSVLLIVGFVALALALLRALQTETGTALTGNLSWIPLACTMLALVVVAGILASRIPKKTL